MTEAIRVEHAKQEVLALLERIKAVEAETREMLHLENLKEPYAHAVSSQFHNFETHSRNPGWTMAEGAMMLCLAGVDAGHSDEFIITILKKTLQTAHVSSEIFEVMKPLSEIERSQVLSHFNEQFRQMGDLPNVPKEKMH